MFYYSVHTEKTIVQYHSVTSTQDEDWMSATY